MIRNIFALIPGRYKKGLLPLTISMIFKTVIDLAGLALIIPFLMLLLDNGNLEKIPVLKEIYECMGIGGIAPFASLIIILLLIALIIKGLIGVYIVKYQNTYILSIYRYLSARLFRSYFNRGYLYVKYNNVSDFTFKINSICYVFSLNVLTQILVFIADLFISIAIIVIIFIFSPFSAITIIVSVTPAILLYILHVRKRLAKFGKAEMSSSKEIMQVITETFKGYPEMKINNVFPAMSSKFERLMKRVSNNHTALIAVQQYPGTLMDLSVVLCIGLLIIFNLLGTVNMSLSLAFFTVGALRILPAVKGMVASYTSIKNNKYASDIILEGINYSDNEELDNTTSSVPCFQELQVNNLHFSYPGGDEIFRGLSFKIQKGERVGIKGYSGIGKTTLFNILTGLIKVSDNEVVALSTESKKIDLPEWQRIIGYVPQEVTILNASIAENIAISIDFEIQRETEITLREIIEKNKIYNKHFNISDSIREKIEKCIERARLKEFVDSLPDGIFTVIGDGGSKISGGEKQRIGIARALFKEPQILFFDEATSALDSKTESEISDSIKNLTEENHEITFLIIAHRESSLAMCNRLIEINK